MADVVIGRKMFLFFIFMLSMFLVLFMYSLWGDWKEYSAPPECVVSERIFGEDGRFADVCLEWQVCGKNIKVEQVRFDGNET